MKVVIYGASVTAQKDKSGFFQHLLSNANDINFVRIPFGASHLHYAGIAMIQKVINEQPDICVLDWATPSTKVFPHGTVERINRMLLKHNIKPLWVLFPRQDDQECGRECCQQIIASESEEVSVKNFSNSSFFKEKCLDKILRDAVHTTECGAILYSSFILDSIKNISQKEIDFSRFSLNELIPKLSAINITLEKDNPIRWNVDVKETSNIKIYLHSEIGPKSPIIKIELFDEKGKIQYSAEKNTVDPWCHYERNMLLDLPAISSIAPGLYTIEISTTDGYPFEKVTPLKPIKEQDYIANHDRFLKIHEVSIDTNADIYL